MVSLGPETIAHIGGFAVTNTALSTLITDGVIVSVAVLMNRALALHPGRLQNMVESVVEYFHELTEQIAGDRAETIFPWFLSFFLFIFIDNIMGLLPGFGTVRYLEHATGEYVPLLRGATCDLNTTIALAVVSVAVTHVFSIRFIGIINYLKRFFALNPIFMFVGLLELVSEGTKLVSLSFRLFGNIYAGEVVLSTVSSMGAYAAFLAPLPFLLFEIVVALIQALVFSMLSMVFMSVMTTAPEH